MSASKKYYQSSEVLSQVKSGVKESVGDQKLDSFKTKKEIEALKQIITQKIKDPLLAKKAALIISEMIKK